jgi:hypothetical protein
VILQDAKRPTVMIVCERRDGTRFNHFSSTSVEAIRLLKTTSPDYYWPLYLVRNKEGYAR